MRRLAAIALLACVGLLGATARADNIDVLWTSANTDVYFNSDCPDDWGLEFEGEVTKTETICGYLILEWRDADYLGPDDYEDWENSGTGTPDGTVDTNQVYLRSAGMAISTTTTVPSTLVSIHLDGDDNDGLADIKVDGTLVAELDMNTTGLPTGALIVVKALPYTTHTIEVMDDGGSHKGEPYHDDVHIYGAAVLAPATAQVTNRSFEDEQDGVMPNGVSTSTNDNWGIPRNWPWRMTANGHLNGHGVRGAQAWVTHGEWCLSVFTQANEEHSAGDFLEFYQTVDLTKVETISFNVKLATHAHTRAYFSVGGDKLWTGNTPGKEYGLMVDVSTYDGEHEIALGVEAVEQFSGVSPGDGRTWFDDLDVHPFCDGTTAACWSGCLTCEDPDCKVPPESLALEEETNFVPVHLALVQARSKINRFQEAVHEILLKQNPPPKKIEKVADVQDAIAAILLDFDEQGAGHVVIFGHGSPGHFKIGEDDLADPGIQDKFIDAIRSNELIKTLTLYGCQVSQGAEGQAFLKKLTEGLKRPVHTWDGKVYAFGNDPVIPEDMQNRFFIEGDTDKKEIPAVTEWGLVVMILLVLAAGTVVIRRVRAGTVQA